MSFPHDLFLFRSFVIYFFLLFRHSFLSTSSFLFVYFVNRNLAFFQKIIFFILVIILVIFLFLSEVRVDFQKGCDQEGQ